MTPLRKPPVVRVPAAPLEYRVVWERVDGHVKNTALVRMIQAVYDRRNRKAQKVYGKLVLRAMRLGILVPNVEAIPSTAEVAQG